MFVCGAVDPEVERDHIARLRRAIQLAGLTEQQACLEMGISQSQWSEQCAGRGHVSYTRIARLPAEVVRWLALLTAEAWGLPLEIEQSTRVMSALFGRRRADKQQDREHVA